MGRPSDKPRYNIVCTRISDQELAVLEDLVRQKRTSISKLLREALQSKIMEQCSGNRLKRVA